MQLIKYFISNACVFLGCWGGSPGVTDTTTCTRHPGFKKRTTDLINLESREDCLGDL